MKKLIASAFLAAFALTANVQAEKPAPAAPAEGEEVVYSVGMTGVTWNGCKASVRAAFSKLAGVKKESIEIEPGEDPGTQKVTVVSTSADLTKEQAIASLGAKAKRFVVHTWAKAGE